VRFAIEIIGGTAAAAMSAAVLAAARVLSAEAGVTVAAVV